MYPMAKSLCVSKLAETFLFDVIYGREGCGSVVCPPLFTMRLDMHKVARPSAGCTASVSLHACTGGGGGGGGGHMLTWR